MTNFDFLHVIKFLQEFSTRNLETPRQKVSKPASFRCFHVDLEITTTFDDELESDIDCWLLLLTWWRIKGIDIDATYALSHGSAQGDLTEHPHAGITVGSVRMERVRTTLLNMMLWRQGRSELELRKIMGALDDACPPSVVHGDR